MSLFYSTRWKRINKVRLFLELNIFLWIEWTFIFDIINRKLRNFIILGIIRPGELADFYSYINLGNSWRRQQCSIFSQGSSRLVVFSTVKERSRYGRIKQYIYILFLSVCLFVTDKRQNGWTDWVRIYCGISHERFKMVRIEKMSL